MQKSPESNQAQESSLLYNPRILIGEDENSLRTILKKFFVKSGYEVESVSHGEIALKRLLENDYAVAILDIKMPGKTGLEILSKLKSQGKNIDIIIMTAQDTMSNAIEAMKNGAYDYIAKPFELEEIAILVSRAIKARKLKEEVKQLRENITNGYDREAKIIGISRTIRELYKTIGKVSASQEPVLITGESGTGKELVTRAIHQSSERANHRFIAVNCAAIPKDLLESELFGYRKGAFTGADENRSGFFEMAHLGSLFLDEIGDMPLGLQGKLLRVLQEKEIQRIGSRETQKVDVRILAATNQNLEILVKEKKFREDLYFRLNVIPIHLLPLRERPEDIPALCEHFLSRIANDMKTSPKSLTPKALQYLQKFSWPGNIRQLENTLKRAAILSRHDYLEVKDFAHLLEEQSELSQQNLSELGLEEIIETKLKSFLEKTQIMPMHNLYEMIIQMAERPLIKLVLKENRYNQIKTANILGINRNTLRKKIKELNISLKEDSTA